MALAVAPFYTAYANRLYDHYVVQSSLLGNAVQRDDSIPNPGEEASASKPAAAEENTPRPFIHEEVAEAPEPEGITLKRSFILTSLLPNINT